MKDRKFNATTASGSEPEPGATVKVGSGLVSGEAEFLAVIADRVQPPLRGDALIELVGGRRLSLWGGVALRDQRILAGTFRDLYVE